MAKQKHRIVILGAGFGGVYTYQHLHRIFHGDTNVSISVINEHNYFLFTPLLHEVATGGQARENIVEPLRGELRCLEDLHLETATEIDPKKQIVHTTEEEIPYDYLVLATGSSTNFFGTPGAEEHSYALKSLKDAVRLKNHVIHSIERASHHGQCDERRQRLTFVVVGGGATGVELVAELHELCAGTLAPLYHHLDLAKYSNIFALGDVAAFTNPGENRPVPTHAQTAVAEASRVAENLARSIKKQKLKRFRYKHKGDLISLGRWRAVGETAGVTFSGRFAWWLWRTVYLFKLLSWQKKVKVAVDWTLNIFAKRDIAEL